MTVSRYEHHYTEARELLSKADTTGRDDEYLPQAQVHATLALAAATRDVAIATWGHEHPE
jgi:hypothetical protein